MTTPAPDWHLLDDEPVAPNLGPFVTPQFLSSLWRHRALWGGQDSELIIAAGDGAAALERAGDVLSFLGHEDLVDYRSPVGRGAGVVAKAVTCAGTGVRFRFDSLPGEAADAIEQSLRDLGVNPERAQHTVSAVVALPDSFDAYLHDIGKKERHETRRKRRRFEAVLGEPRIQTFRGESAALDEFIELHRHSAGEKGRFMTPAMAELFHDLAGDDRWRVDGLYGDDDRMVAAAFAWSDGTGYYLYNSAYDPAAGEASPGVVLIAMLIERAIEEDLTVFDFLKGDEQYKFRLGAVPRQLYVVEGQA